MRHALPIACGLAVALSAAIPSSAFAQASDPFLAQIMTTGANFCPKGWIETQGQLLPINQNLALFALLGTSYGGDGRTTFALPVVKPTIPVQGSRLVTCIALQGVFPSRN